GRFTQVLHCEGALSMCRFATVSTLALGSVMALTAMVRADVVIRGPFGRQIVVPSPNDVHIGPRNVMVNPTTTAPPGLLPGETIEPPLAVGPAPTAFAPVVAAPQPPNPGPLSAADRSEEHTSELQSPCNLVCRLLLEKKKKNNQ